MYLATNCGPIALFRSAPGARAATAAILNPGDDVNGATGIRFVAWETEEGEVDLSVGLTLISSLLAEGNGRGGVITRSMTLCIGEPEREGDIERFNATDGMIFSASSANNRSLILSLSLFD